MICVQYIGIYDSVSNKYVVMYHIHVVMVNTWTKEDLIEANISVIYESE